jgi:cytoskeletal protein RodZ
MALFQRIKSPFADNEPEAQCPPASEAQSVGEMLRRQRLTLDIDVTVAAAALKIKPTYLAAIEEGCPDRLPGATYALGFVRSYSEYLGLDSREILRRLKLEAAAFNVKPDLTFPMPLGERGLPTGWTLTMATLLAACGYGAWYYLAESERIGADRVIAVPKELLSAKPEADDKTKRTTSVVADSSFAEGLAHTLGSEASRGQPSSGSVVPSHTGASENTVGSDLSRFGLGTKGAGSPPQAGASPLTSERAPTAAPPAVAAMTAAPPSSAPVSVPTTKTSVLPDAAVLPPSRLAGSVTGVKSSDESLPSAPNPATALAAPLVPSGLGAEDYPSRVTVRANAESWIQIRAADRSVVFTGVLKPGEIYRVPYRTGLTLRVGNAGGLDVIVDGKLTSSLGPMGAVRNVPLDPQSLMGQGVDHY